MAWKKTFRLVASFGFVVACSANEQGSQDYTQPVDPATAQDAGAPFDDASTPLPNPMRDAGVLTDAGGVKPDAGSIQADAGSGSSDPIVHGKDPTKTSAAGKGEFTVAQITSGIRNGSAFADRPTIYYPTDAQAPFSLVALIPGYGAGSFYVQAWAPFLASHGFAVILLDPNRNSDQPTARADALLDAVESLKAEHVRDASPLKGKLDVTRVALMGHSMGGGGTHIAANRTPSLRAAVPLSPWNDGASFGMTMVPTLDIAGSADTTARPKEHARPFYDSIPRTTPKMYIEIRGGNHNVSDSPNKNAVIARYTLSWLKVFADGDERYRKILSESPEGTSAGGFDTTL